MHYKAPAGNAGAFRPAESTSVQIRKQKSPVFR